MDVEARELGVSEKPADSTDSLKRLASASDEGFSSGTAERGTKLGGRGVSGMMRSPSPRASTVPQPVGNMKGVGGASSMRTTVPSIEPPRMPPRMIGAEWSMLASTARIVAARLRMVAIRAAWMYRRSPSRRRRRRARRARWWRTARCSLLAEASWAAQVATIWSYSCLPTAISRRVWETWLASEAVRGARAPGIGARDSQVPWVRE